MKNLPAIFAVVFLLFSSCSGFAEETSERQVVERFWTLLEKSPRRGTSLDRVFGYYVDTGQLGVLLERCRSRTETDPENSDAWLLFGLVLLRSGDEERAVEALKKSISIDGGPPLAGLYLGEAHIARGRLRDAVDALELVVKNTEKNDEDPSMKQRFTLRDRLAVLQTLGRVYERFGDRSKAVDVWNRLEAMFPDDEGIRLQIAETLEEEGKLEDARDRYKKLAEGTKENFDRVRYTLAAAEIKIRLGDKQAAVDDFEKLLDGISGESWLADSIRDRLERVFIRSVDYPGLAEYYRKRLEKHPDELDTVRRRAVVLVRLSLTEEAGKLLSDTLERAPQNVALRLALIDLLVSEKKFEEAARHYAKIDEIEPNNPDHIVQWGLVMLENTALDEERRKAAAVKIWNRLIAAKPNDAATVVTVADLANAGGIPDEAERLYHTAIELKPNDPGYIEYLGYFYHHRQRKDEAVLTFRKIAGGARRTAASLAQLAGIFRSIGYRDEAIRTYGEAVEMNPDETELRMQYAGLLLDEQRFEEAEKQFAALETLLEPLGEQASRFLQSYVKLLEATDRLGETALSLRRDIDEGRKRTPENFWRLALFQSALGKTPDAVKSIEKALEAAPDSNTLLDAAAGIFVQADDRRRAVKIYAKLAETDPPRRIDHLRRLANLHRELGEIDKAVEAARLAMATGAGNPANVRFYADMLFAAKRKKEGIEALRRAVRLDPGDETTSTVLAEALFTDGQTDEAVEITWRLFEKTENLQDKLGIVSRLTTYYQKKSAFPQLLERLRRHSKDAVSRRESAFCQAQAQVAMSLPGEARKVLESLLLDVTEKQADDLVLLAQLSQIAEMQNDLPAAVRYQEMLCEKSKSVEDGTRLLMLYRQAGQRDKTVEHLMRTLSERGKLHDRIDLIDDFLRREEYVSARQLLDRIEAKHPNSWEILYRRLMLDYWQNDIEAAKKNAETLLAMHVDRSEPSARKRFEASKSDTAFPKQRNSMRIGLAAVSIPYPASGWQFQQNTPGIANETVSRILQQWNLSNGSLLKTLYRDKLRHFEPTRTGRTSSVPAGTSKQTPPKPLFVPENFGDVRLAALAWQLRLNLLEEERSGFKTDIPIRTLVESRKRLPDNDPDTATMTERLRFEFFLNHFCETTLKNVERFRETNYPVLLLGGLLKDGDGTTPDAPACMAAGRRLRQRMAYELALRGERDWYPTAHHEVLEELFTESVLPHLPKLVPDDDFDRKLNEHLSDPVLHEVFSKDQIDMARNSLVSELRTIRKEAETAADSYKSELRFELLRRCWNEIDRGTFENAPGGESDLYLLLADYPLYVKVLRLRGLDEEYRRSKRILESTAHRLTWVRPHWVDAEILELFEGAAEARPDSLSMLIELVRLRQQSRHAVSRHWSFAFHGLWFPGTVDRNIGLVSKVYDFVKWNERDTQDDPDGKRFERFLARLDVMKESILSDRLSPQSTAQLWMGNGRLVSPAAQYDAFLSKYLATRLFPLQESMTLTQGGSTNSVSYAVVGNLLVHYEMRQNRSNPLPRTVDRKQLDTIEAASKEVYRVLNVYFKLMEKIESTPATEDGDEPAPALLTRFRASFESVKDDPLEQEHRLRRQLVTGSPTSAEQTLTLAAGFMNAVREFLDTAKPEEKQDVAAIGRNYMLNFNANLQVLSTLGSDSEIEHVRAFHTIQRFYARPQQARYTGESSGETVVIPNGELVENLESEIRPLREKGETPDPRKLLMLATLYKRQSDFVKAAEYLDAVSLENPADLRLREQWILKMYNLGAGPETLKERATLALESFRNDDMNEDELRDVQKAQQLSGRTDEASESRRRQILLARDIAAQYALLKDFVKEGMQRNPDVVDFAVKVFWEPEVQKMISPNPTARQTREMALDILATAGKIDDLVKQAETKQKETEATLEELVSLAELYFRAGRREELEKTIKLIDAKFGEVEKQSLHYTGFLNRSGMDSMVARWRHQVASKAASERLENFAAYPEGLLNNLAKEAGDSEKFGLVPRFIEILLQNDAEPLARSFEQLVFHIERWLDRSVDRNAARRLLEYLWKMERTDVKTRREIRLQIVSKISHRTKYGEYYPMFRDVIVDYVKGGPPEKSAKARSTPDPFHISVWGVERAFGVAVVFLDLAEKEGKLEELAAEFRTIADSAASAGNGDLWSEATGRLLSTMCEARLGHGKKTFEEFQKLQKVQLRSLAESGPAIGDVFRSGNLPLAQELAALDDPRILSAASKAFEQELKTRRSDTRLDRIVNRFQKIIAEKMKRQDDRN